MLFILPTLTAGSEMHDAALSMRNWVLVGLFIGPAFVRWAQLELAWHVKSGRNFEGWSYMPLVTLATIPGAPATYVVVTLLRHAPDGWPCSPSTPGLPGLQAWPVLG